MTQELETKAPRPFIEVVDPLPILDSGRFDAIQRIASIMARSSLTPAHLRETAVVDEDGNKVYERGKAVVESLPYDAVFANCFLIVNQAIRWGIDPFVTASCTSVVSGRLCYEGKLVAGVLDAKLGIELNYEWNELKGDAFGITVSGRTQKRGELKSISGTVGEWKTTRKGSPWAVTSNHRRMLVYRGNREWARIFKPSLMLGVYTEDEIDALETRRSIAPVQHALGRPQEPGVAFDNKGVAHPGMITTEHLVMPGEVRFSNAEHHDVNLVTGEETHLVAPKATWSPKEIQELRDLEVATGISEKLKAMVKDATPQAEEAGPVDENPTVEATSSMQSPISENSTAGSETPSSESSSTEASPSPETPAVPERTDEVLPEPTRAEDYEAFWIKCLAVAEDRKDAAAEWAGQRKIRTKLAVDMDVVERCKAMVDRDFPKE